MKLVALAAIAVLMNRTDPATSSAQDGGKPDNAALFAKFAQAQQRHQAGELAPARALMQEVLDADPKNLELALSIARWLAKERQDFVGAEPFARRACALDPASFEAANLLGASLISTRRYEEAETVYRAAVARFEHDATMRYGLAMACGQQKKYLEAKVEYARTLELEPGSGLFRFSAGENFANLREFAAAEREFRRAVELKGPVDAAWKLGEVLAQEGKDAEAEKVLNAALLVGPKLTRWSAGVQLGAFLFERGRHEESAAILHQATKLRPEGRDGWMWLARAERALGHEEAAGRALRRYQELRAKEDAAEEERLLDLIKAQLEERAR